MKAKLTGGQVVAAVIAGILGHGLFSAGWALLWGALAGGLLSGILGVTLRNLSDQWSEAGDASGWFDAAGGLIGGLVVGAVIAGLVLLLLAFLVSGWILKGGKARKPWATTFWSLLIVAVLSLPLFILYVAISGRGDGGLPFPLVAFLGTAIVGVLVWLWMTWANRGPAVAEPLPAATPVEPVPVTPAPPAPAVEAPAKAPARKPAPKKDPSA